MSQIMNDLDNDEDCIFNEIMSSQMDIDVMTDDRSIADKLDSILKFLASDSIKNIPVDVFEEKVITITAESTQKILDECMKTIDVLMKKDDTAEQIKFQLDILVNMLKCWDLCIEHIQALEKISIIDIKSFPCKLLQNIFDVLSHCKDSSNSYGNNFQSLTNNLASLFNQSVKTLNAFYNLMDEIITFDLNENDQTEILLKIIDNTGKLATLSIGTDTKTLSDLWKRFGKLSTNHNLEIKRVSPSTAANHFKGLAGNIVNVLSSIIPTNQQSINERNILCSRLLLKILEKLCDTYCGWIRAEVMIVIIDLLTNIQRYSEQHLRINKFSKDFIKFVSTNFTFALEPFMDILFKNDSFKTAYFDYGNGNVKDHAAYHLLTLCLTKKLSRLPYETQREWNNQKRSIIDVCLQNVDLTTKEICKGQLEVQMSRDINQSSYKTNLYEATCLSIFELICQIPDEEVSELMYMLLKHILRGKYFTALIAADVWCFISRLCSSEMCFDNFQYLLQIYEMLKDRPDDMNVIVLSSLLSRQFTFLTDEDNAEFFDKMEKSADSHSWKPFVRNFDVQKKKRLQQSIDAEAIILRIAQDLKNLQEQPCLNNFETIIKHLNIIEASEMPQNDPVAQTLNELWNKIVYILGDCEGAVLKLMEDLAVALIRATRPEQEQSKYMTTVLESMASLYPFTSTRLRLEMCYFLDRSASSLSVNDAIVLGELYVRLLSDADCYVQQQAHENFLRLSQINENPQLISKLVMKIKNCNYEVSRKVQAYIGGHMVHHLCGFEDLNGYFDALSDVNDNSKHVCCTRIPWEGREEKVPKLNGDDKMSDEIETEDLQSIVDRICTDMEIVTKKQSKLKKENSDRLRGIFKSYLEQGDEPMLDDK